MSIIRSETVAHRSTRRLAEKYIASFADTLGDTFSWNGSANIPIHVEWAVVPATKGFDIVSTVTSRPADPTCWSCGSTWLQDAGADDTGTPITTCGRCGERQEEE
jgi:hypothetical protein